MFRSKIKSIAGAAVIVVGVCAGAAFAQRGVADSVVFDVAPVLQMYPSNAPVMAFAVHQNVLWSTGANALLQQPTTSGRATIQEHRQLGNISANGITGIVIDNGGRVWVAAAAGVAVREGNAFRSYTSADGLPEGAVLAIGAGGNGDVWIGTENGAARFRGGSWQKFTTEEGLPSNKVQAIAVTAGGRAFLGTDRGVAAHNGTAFHVYNMRNGDLSRNDVRVLHAVAGTENVWAAVGPADVNFYENGAWRQFPQIRHGIESIMWDGRWVWFGSREGLDRFNGQEWTTDPGLLGIQANHVRSMYYSASDESRWFGQNDGVTAMIRRR